ncbi:MAG: hypothetical protein CL761_03325 [Chloroflexi bacterium]|nr:hypothetical protein [Chloroflexota bacterium]|tara:strand:- start:1143 stop:1973 length:831 start_codon:yes stop_codon:yes gene_type:complete
MSKIKVDTIQSTQHATSTIGLTSTGATINGDCNATTFTGSGANLTNVPAPSTFDAANLTGTIPNASLPNPLPAIDGSALTSLTSANLTGAIPANLLTNAGGGAFEFVQKIEPPSTVTEIDKTGLEYDTLYKIIIPEANFNSNTVMGMKVFLDNATTMTDYSNFFGNFVNESNSSGNQHSASYWTFDMDGYHSSKHGGSIDFYTGSRPYVLAKFINPNTVYGFVSFWGGKENYTNNTNNDPNQTATHAKANGFRLFSPQGWSFTTDTKILLYKYKEA